MLGAVAVIHFGDAHNLLHFDIAAVGTTAT
jgi:hypothetical protein